MEEFARRAVRHLLIAPVETLLAALDFRQPRLYEECKEREMADFFHDREAEFARYGEECVAIARNARTNAQRIMLLHIAETFLRLAESESEDQGALTLH